jgi:menaquinone-dependent protoporphyrinogen oxidase
MKVLVTAASRHGATWEIAEAIGAALCDEGLSVDLVRLDEYTDPDPGGCDAVVLGSAVYGAHWLLPAARWAGDHRDVLRTKRVWLFSSGPVVEGPLPAERDAVLVEGVTADLGATGHRLFGGRLDRSRLTAPELAVVTAFRVADVDARDFGAAAAWARAIAATLGTARTMPATPATGTGR